MPCPIRAGQLVAGKFRVERVLGAGGMGIVVAATHIELDRRVALKFLQPAALDQPSLVKRFAREARAAARLTSEHVARVLDVGALDDGAPYIVMEYLEGEDLARVIAARAPLTPVEVADDIVQVCDAVAEAHSHGIVHRDLKPANLFVTKRANGDPILKVLDFGISKFERPGDLNVTTGSKLLGSPVYMSPEQLWSPAEVDARSDIWSLGVILYEMLTGRPPFSAVRAPELVAAILHKPPEPMGQEGARVPPELQAAIYRCLEKDPARRFANVARFADVLAVFGSDESRHIASHIRRESAPRAKRISALRRHDSERPADSALSERSDSIPGAIRSVRRSSDATATPWGSRFRKWSWAHRNKLVIAGLGAVGMVAAWGAFGSPSPHVRKANVNPSSHSREANPSPLDRIEAPGAPEASSRGLPPPAASEVTTQKEASKPEVEPPPAASASAPRAPRGPSSSTAPVSPAPSSNPLMRLRPM
ncbi:MAG: serine/threonine protein kinase [Polyangiaceae bacterium]|nr:serine/threonine protein kinase [Polyangiaceae bacterium]